MDARKVVLAIGIVVFALFAVNRFVPSIPLSLISHTKAEKPDPTLEPVQEDIPQEEATPLPFPMKNVSIIPRALYDISAEVVSIERYRFDKGAPMIPYDVALRWGDLVKEPYRNAISYHQDARFFHWGTHSSSLDRNVIVSHAANVHIVPASSRIRSVMGRVRRGNVVRLQGKLVDLEGSGPLSGFVWRSSLTRNDTDAGSCETMYVESVNVDGKLYR